MQTDKPPGVVRSRLWGWPKWLALVLATLATYVALWAAGQIVGF